MTERWLLAKLYYSIADGQGDHDPNGDLILIHLVKPAMEEFRRQGWVHWSTFMRFAEQGYHIRLMLYGDGQVLADQVVPFIERAFDRHKEMFPQTHDHPMELMPLAVSLNRRWVGPHEEFPVRAPGSIFVDLASGTGDDDTGETEDILSGHHNLHSDACRRMLELIEGTPSYKGRKIFISLLIDDFLGLAGLSPLERYDFLTFSRLQWIDYFNIGPEALAPHDAHYRAHEEGYRRHFARKRGPEGSLALVPESLREPYRSWIDAMRTLVPGLIGRDGTGALTLHAGLRLRSFFHLMHNRAGIGMLQEISLCHILAEHYRSFLSQDDIARFEERLQQLTTFPSGETSHAGKEIP